MKMNEDELELLGALLDNSDLIALIMKLMQEHLRRHSEILLGVRLEDTSDRELSLMKARLEGAKRAIKDFEMSVMNLKNKAH